MTKRIARGTSRMEETSRYGRGQKEKGIRRTVKGTSRKERPGGWRGIGGWRRGIGMGPVGGRGLLGKEVRRVLGLGLVGVRGLLR